MDAEVYFLSFFILNASSQYILELGLLVGRHDVGTYGRDIMEDYCLTIDLVDQNRNGDINRRKIPTPKPKHSLSSTHEIVIVKKLTSLFCEILKTNLIRNCVEIAYVLNSSNLNQRLSLYSLYNFKI